MFISVDGKYEDELYCLLLLVQALQFFTVVLANDISYHSGKCSGTVRTIVRPGEGTLILNLRYFAIISEQVKGSRTKSRKKTRCGALKLLRCQH